MGVIGLLSQHLASPDDLLDVFAHNHSTAGQRPDDGSVRTIQTGPGLVVQRVKVDDRGAMQEAHSISPRRFCLNGRVGRGVWTCSPRCWRCVSIARFNFGPLRLREIDLGDTA